MRALRTPTQYAEEIKIRYACALAKLAGAGETIKVPSVGEAATPSGCTSPRARYPERPGGRAALSP